MALLDAAAAAGRGLDAAAAWAAVEKVASREQVTGAVAVVDELVPDDDGSAEAALRAALTDRYRTVRPFVPGDTTAMTTAMPAAMPAAGDLDAAARAVTDALAEWAAAIAAVRAEIRADAVAAGGDPYGPETTARLREAAADARSARTCPRTTGPPTTL